MLKEKIPALERVVGKEIDLSKKNEINLKAMAQKCQLAANLLIDKDSKRDSHVEYNLTGSIIKRYQEQAYKSGRKFKLENGEYVEITPSCPWVNIKGYFPLRRDFEIEYDQEAENYIADMEFHDEDLPSEVTLKKELLEIFNKRLDERIKRKNFVIDHNILDKNSNLAIKKRTKDEKLIRERLAPYERFHKVEDHTLLVNNIIRLKDLKRRIDCIESLQQEKKNSFQEIENCMLAKRKDKGELQLKKSLMRKANQPENTVTHDRNGKLNELETELCSRINMEPHQFHSIKQALAFEAVRQGYVELAVGEKEEPCFKRTPDHRIMEIFDFVVTRK